MLCTHSHPEVSLSLGLVVLGAGKRGAGIYYTKHIKRRSSLPIPKWKHLCKQERGLSLPPSQLLLVVVLCDDD